MFNHMILILHFNDAEYRRRSKWLNEGEDGITLWVNLSVETLAGRRWVGKVLGGADE